MRHLQNELDLEDFYAALHSAEQSALLLDYDGTLAPFTTERDQAYPYAGVRERLNRLNRSAGTRLVIVSGRPADDVVGLLGLESAPEVFGLHGAERRLRDGTTELVKLRETTRKGLAEADAWAEKHDLIHRCEIKPISRAFHWRGLTPEATEAMRAGIVQQWQDTAEFYGLVLHEFDGGLELKADGIDKGSAVREILRELRNDAVVAYLGDDHTDEDAFAALAGRGLRILVRTEERATAADIWLQPPEELLTFLDSWLEAVD